MDPKTELTNEESIAVIEFRNRVSDLLPRLDEFHGHDLGLIRFIRARENNLDRAEEMFRKYMQWRLDEDIDNALNIKIPLEIEQMFPIKLTGFDNAGNPVVLVTPGSYDIRKAVENGNRDEIMRFAYKVFELSLAICKRQSTEDKYVSQMYAVLDFEGFSFFQIASRDAVELCIAIVRVFESNYPEILKTAVVINAPKVFQVLWAIIKPMLTKRTLSKIHIHGSNKAAWKQDIFSTISPKCFSSEYGGSITTVPNIKLNEQKIENIFPRTEYKIFPEKALETIQIGARDKHQVQVNATEGSVIEWNFTTDQCDIGFQVHFDGVEDVVKYCRVDSDNHVQVGKVIATETGTYTFTFDNSFSSFKGKTLNYIIECRNPNECEKIM